MNRLYIRDVIYFIQYQQITILKNKCVAGVRMIEQGRWQLRHAAGSYWLLDMKQGPESRKSPLSLNQVGAELWNLFQQGAEEEAAVDMLCCQYQIDRDSALEDVRGFLAGLEAQGIAIE